MPLTTKAKNRLLLFITILASSSLSISLALSEPSNLYCFGASSSGQLGYKLSGLSDQFVALPVAPHALKFSVLSSGDGYTCGVTKAFGVSLGGTIYCWGAGSGGQLGYGGSEDQYVPIRTFLFNVNASFIGSPTPINGGFGFYSKGFTLSASKYGGGSSSDSGKLYGSVTSGVHTCAISSIGNLYCWGDRSSFSGRNTSSIAYVPEKIDLPSSINATRTILIPSSGGGGGLTTETWKTTVTPTSFISVSNGGGFTCAVMEVLTNSSLELVNSVTNSSGRRQLQNATETPTPSPSPSPTTSPPPSATRSSTPTPSSSRPFAPNGVCFGRRNPISGSGTVLVSTRTVFASISAGLNHACGVSITGSVSCFGSGKYGQLGNGTFEDVYNGEPVQVSLPAAASSVACGDTFSCALLTTRKIYCWGSNLNGRLGTGSTSDGNFSTPQILKITFNLEFLTVGATHSCASSALYTFCWGEIRFGQQGNNREVTFPTTKVEREPLYMVPMQTDVNTGVTLSATYFDKPTSKDITQYQQDTQKIYGSTGGGVSAGTTHTCLLPSDYTSIGTAWCLGEGYTGALGFANSNAISTSISSVLGPIAKPVSEAKSSSTSTTSWSLGTGATSFNSGAGILTVGKCASACVLRGDSRTAECFGSRNEGVLGDGSFSGLASSPSPSVGGMSFSSISLGKSHGCGIDISNSSLYCWGRLLLNSSTPTLASDANWTSINSGDNFSCGIQSTGKGYCLGTDISNTGRLGVDMSIISDEQRTWNTLFELKPSQWLSTLVPWQTIAAGSSHACGLANSTLYCWGENKFGQLGNGVTTAQVGFAIVTGDRLWSSVAVGVSHSCAIEATDGAVYCWGSNQRGQIGFTVSSFNLFFPRPTRVPGSALTGSEILPQGDVWLSVTAGDFHTCVLSSKGRLVCFGDNSDGQLGSKAPSSPAAATAETVEAALSLGLTNSSFVSAPAEVLAISAFGAAGASWKAVSAGGKKTCALLTMMSASPSATPSSSPSPTQTPTVSGTPSTTPIIPSKSPTPSVTPSRSFTSTTSAIPAGVSRSRTPTPSVTPSESPVASPPPTPFFNADLKISGMTSALATNSSVQRALLVTVSTLMNVDITKVAISSIIDNSTGTPVLLFSSRRLAYKTRQHSRQLQGGSSPIIFKVTVVTGTASNAGGSSSSSSASKATLLTSYLNGTVPLPASAQNTLGGTSPLSMLSSVSGVPISSLSANVVPNSVVVEPVYVPHVYPTRTSTSTPSATQTPIVTNLVGIIVASSKGTALSSFQIAGFVAAGLAGVCFCAGFWLCVKLSIFDKCCCRAKKVEQVSVKTLAANEFKGRGPIRIARRQPRKSDAIGMNPGGTVDNSDKIDGVSFNTVIVNPLHETKQFEEEEENNHDEL